MDDFDGILESLMADLMDGDNDLPLETLTIMKAKELEKNVKIPLTEALAEELRLGEARAHEAHQVAKELESKLNALIEEHAGEHAMFWLKVSKMLGVHEAVPMELSEEKGKVYVKYSDEAVEMCKDLPLTEAMLERRQKLSELEKKDEGFSENEEFGKVLDLTKRISLT